MKRRHLNLIGAAVVALAMQAAVASDFKVIANNSVTVSALSEDDLKAVFLCTKTSLSDGSHAEPVLVKGGPVHEEFLKTLGKTEASLGTYYRSLVFTGKAPMPKTLASDAEVVSYVARTKGAIGYVSPGAATPGVKTLQVK